jgi:hypothetical protein
MSVKEAPVITACKANENWTCVTFKPDLAKFGMVRVHAWPGRLCACASVSAPTLVRQRCL